MKISFIAFIFAVTLMGTAEASAQGPDPHRFACQGDRTQQLISYYLEQSIQAATKAETMQVTLSRFGYEGGRCYARVDVDGGNGPEMTWANYTVSQHPNFAIRLWLTEPIWSLSSLPTETHPHTLNAALEKEMRASGYPAHSTLQGPRLPIAKLETLSAARKELLAAGWQPVKNTDEELEFGAKDFVSAGYVETEDCAMDVSVCALRYTNKKGECLRVFVDGERPSEAYVDSWSFACPKD